MVFFTDIQPTAHYLEEHEDNVPWDQVIEIILTMKNPRKKGNKFEIERDNYYLLFEIRNNTLYIINAKNTKR